MTTKDKPTKYYGWANVPPNVLVTTKGHDGYKEIYQKKYINDPYVFAYGCEDENNSLRVHLLPTVEHEWNPDEYSKSGVFKELRL